MYSQKTEKLFGLWTNFFSKFAFTLPFTWNSQLHCLQVVNSKREKYFQIYTFHFLVNLIYQLFTLNIQFQSAKIDFVNFVFSMIWLIGYTYAVVSAFNIWTKRFELVWFLKQGHIVHLNCHQVR